MGKVFEFAGSVIAGMTTDERATLTNMTAELGGFTGIAVPDAETVRFLRERRGVDVRIEPLDAERRGHPLWRVDCAAIGPMVAAPGDWGTAGPCARSPSGSPWKSPMAGPARPASAKTSTRYHEVLSWADAQGLKVAPHVHPFLQFGTAAVRDWCVSRGYIDTFLRVGAGLLEPGCGACAN